MSRDLRKAIILNGRLISARSNAQAVICQQRQPNGRLGPPFSVIILKGGGVLIVDEAEIIARTVTRAGRKVLIMTGVEIRLDQVFSEEEDGFDLIIQVSD